MRSFTLSVVALLSALLPTTYAQTYTACNPLNTTGCPDMPALGGNATFVFNDTLYDKIWEKKNQGSVKWSEKGATFTVDRQGDSPLIQSKFYMLFGRVSVIMKAATGQGIISSAILQSEALDEVDWEFVGTKPKEVLTNYFGKGNRTMGDRGKDFNMTTNTQEKFHNYTLDWTKEALQWWLDGEMLREVKFEDALGGKNYPQTPMNIRLGAWSGGDKENNDKFTVEWAGGETDFSKGPFEMTVQEVYAIDYTEAKEYSWDGMDETGSWELVKVIKGKSEAITEYEKPHGAVNRWKALGKGAQIAIIASVIGVVVIVACLILFCCIKQRRAGKREFAALEAQQNKEASELLSFKQQQASTRGGYGRL